MSWLNWNHLKFNLRKTRYNNSLCMNYLNLQKMVDDFDGVFKSILNFTEEIAFIQLYPFKILPNFNDTGKNYLSTARAVFNDIEACNIHPDNSYVTLGEYYVEPYFNNFADYKGYTQIKIYLPQLGFVDVDVNECMGKWLQFRLVVDFYSGKGLHIIGVSNDSIESANSPYANYEEDKNIRTLGTYECSLGIEIPLGTSNVGDIKRNALLGTIKAGLSVGVASYTNSLPPATTSSSTVKTYDIQGRSTKKGSRMKQIKSGTETTTRTTVYNKPVDKSKPLAEAIDGSIDTLNRMSAGGSSDRVNDSGLLWSLTDKVKVVIYRPKLLPTTPSYGSLYGYPLGEVKTLSEIQGYTEVSNIHFEGIGFETITQKEIAMLEDIFSNGVIL